MIKLGDEYAQSMSDKLWECYVRELDEVGSCSTFVVSRSGRTLSLVQQKCQREFSRFTKKELPTKRLKEPDIRTLKLLREEEFGIWLEDEEDEFDYQPGLDYLNEILHMYVLFLSQFAGAKKRQDFWRVLAEIAKKSLSFFDGVTPGWRCIDFPAEQICQQICPQIEKL